MAKQTSDNKNIWKRLSSKIRRRRKSSASDYEDPRHRSKSMSNLTKFTRQGREQLKKLRELVTKKFNKKKTTSDESSFSGSSVSDDKVKQSNLPRSTSFTKFVKKFNPVATKTKDEYIIAGENDHYSKSSNKNTEQQYYPFAGAGAQDMNPVSFTQNAHNVWISSTDSTTGQVVFKNVIDSTKTFVKPNGNGVIVLDHRLVDSVIKKKNTVSGTVSKVAPEPTTSAKTPQAPKDNDLEEFLTLCGLQDKIKIFYVHGINFSMLPDLTKDNLVEMNLSVGDRIKFQKGTKEKFPQCLLNDSTSSITQDIESLLSDDEEDELFYSTYRGRTMSLPNSHINRGISPAITDNDGLESTTSVATIKALTSLVDKILESKYRVVPGVVAQELDSSEDPFDRDRKLQVSIKEQELTRQKRLKALMVKKNIKKNEEYKFHLREEVFSLQTAVQDQEPSKNETKFELDLPDYDFTFLNEDTNQFTFLVNDTDSLTSTPKMNIDDKLDSEIFQLEQEIANAELVVKLDESLRPSHDSSLKSDKLLDRLKGMVNDSGFNEIFRNEAKARSRVFTTESPSNYSPCLEEEESKLSYYLLNCVN